MSQNGQQKSKLLKEIRSARLKAGLRQQDVANALGRPQSFVAKIESGERSVDFLEILDICRIVGLDPKALIDKLS